MKTKNVRILLLVAITLLYSSVILVRPELSQQHVADSMWVEPSSIVFSTTNASIGTEFNVTIWLNMTEDIFAYQIGLRYNRTQLMCTRANYTAGATSDYFKGHTTISPAPSIDGDILGNGSVLAFETVLGYDNITGPHSGSLIWAEFKILTLPVWGNLTSKLDISSAYPTRTWAWDPNKKNLAFTPYDGIYTFIVPTQPRARLTIMSTAGGHTDPTAGTYLLEPDTETTVSASPDPGYYLDRWELDDLYIGIFSPVAVTMDKNHTLQATFKQLDIGHNIATKWIASKTVVGQGFDLSIGVTVMNIGSYAEEFNVTACLQSTSITAENIQLDSGAFTTLTFTMNTSLFSKGNYTISAYAWPVLYETDTSDNNCTGGTITVSIIGDVNGDGKVNLIDVFSVALAYGSYPGHPAWNPSYDINNDDKINLIDYFTTALNYGKTSP